MPKAAPLGRPGELTGRFHDPQVVVQIDPRLQILDQDRPPPRPPAASGGGRVGPELEARPISGEPLDQESTVRMPIDSRKVTLFIPEVHPGRHPTVDRHHAQPYAGILRSGKRIPMLLDLERRFGLVHDRKDGNVRVVDLLEGHHVTARRWPVSAESIELFLSDPLRKAVRHSGTMRRQPAPAGIVRHPDVALANEAGTAAVFRDLGIENGPAREPYKGSLGPAVELALQREHHDIGLLSPDVIRDAGLSEPKDPAAEHLLSRKVLFGYRLAWRREPALRPTRGKVEAPEVPDQVAPLTEEIRDELRVRGVTDLARDRQSWSRIARDLLRSELTPFGGSHSLNGELKKVELADGDPRQLSPGRLVPDFAGGIPTYLSVGERPGDQVPASEHRRERPLARVHRGKRLRPECWALVESL